MVYSMFWWTWAMLVWMLFEMLCVLTWLCLRFAINSRDKLYVICVLLYSVRSSFGQVLHTLVEWMYIIFKSGACIYIYMLRFINVLHVLFSTYICLDVWAWRSMLYVILMNVRLTWHTFLHTCTGILCEWVVHSQI